MFPTIFTILSNYFYIDFVHNNPIKKTKADLFLKGGKKIFVYNELRSQFKLDK